MSSSIIKKTSQICPNCGRAFECKADEISQCQCYGVQLDSALRQSIAELHSSCLCVNCLIAIKDSENNKQKPSGLIM